MLYQPKREANSNAPFVDPVRDAARLKGLRPVAQRYSPLVTERKVGGLPGKKPGRNSADETLTRLAFMPDLIRNLCPLPFHHSLCGN